MYDIPPRWTYKKYDPKDIPKLLAESKSLKLPSQNSEPKSEL